jgi:hypothetical protein
MKSLLALLLSACAATAVPTTTPPSQAPPAFWERWGDGRAELATYRLQMPRYGEVRAGEAVLITVTEDFDPAQAVKADRPRAGVTPALKLNEVRDFPTGLYDYNGLTTVLLPLGGAAPLGVPLKVSFSLQEWCGHVYEQLVWRDDQLEHTLHSYFDGEADRQDRLPVPVAGLVEDAMPLLVRGLVGELLAPGERREVPWLRSRLRDRLDHRPAAWGRAIVQLSASTEQVSVPAGEFLVRTFTADTGDRQLSWQVEQGGDRRLIAWSHSDGERGELLHSQRTPYWTQHGVADEPRRVEAGLPARTWPEPPPGR